MGERMTIERTNKQNGNGILKKGGQDTKVKHFSDIDVSEES